MLNIFSGVKNLYTHAYFDVLYIFFKISNLSAKPTVHYANIFKHNFYVVDIFPNIHNFKHMFTLSTFFTIYTRARLLKSKKNCLSFPCEPMYKSKKNSFIFPCVKKYIICEC